MNTTKNQQVHKATNYNSALHVQIYGLVCYRW